MALAQLQCRNCGAMGKTVPMTDELRTKLGGLGSEFANGMIGEIPLLPRCACYIRLHKEGKLPPAIAALLEDLPDAEAELDVLDDLDVKEHAKNPEGNPEPEVWPPQLDPEDVKRRRATYSTDGLPERREVNICRIKGTGNHNIGTVVVTQEHSLGDVFQLMHEQLQVPLSVKLFRGRDGDPLRIPIPKPQLQMQAMPFFPMGTEFLAFE